MTSEIRIIKIAGHKIKCEFIEENQINEYINLNEYSSNWHKYIIGEYHISQLLKCIRYYYYCFIYNYKTDNLELLGTYLLGHIMHEKVENYREKKIGFIIKEMPILDEFKVENGDIIKMVGKADLLNLLIHMLSDIKTTIYLPESLSNLSDEKIEELYGKYIIQIFSYAYYFNNTYFHIDPFLFTTIILISKRNLKIKLLKFYYDDKVANAFYITMKARAEYIHISLINKEPPIAEVDNSCLSCPFINLCEEGKSYKLDTMKPINMESVEFKKLYSDKRAYYKRDGKWKKTKKFIEFLEKNKKYSKKQIDGFR